MRGTVVMATYNAAGVDRAGAGRARGGGVDPAPRRHRARRAARRRRLARRHRWPSPGARRNASVCRLDVIAGPGRIRGAALLAGFRHVLDAMRRRFIVTLDPDGRHDARQITDLVRMFLARRSGLTIGSRWVQRRLVARARRRSRALASRARQRARSAQHRLACARARRDDVVLGRSTPTSLRTVLDDGMQLEPGTRSTRRSSRSPRPTGSASTRCRSSFRPRYSGVAASRSRRRSSSTAASPRPPARPSRSGPRCAPTRRRGRAGRDRMRRPAGHAPARRSAPTSSWSGWRGRPLLRLDRRRDRAASRAIGSSRSAPASARVSLSAAWSACPDAEMTALEPAANLLRRARQRAPMRHPEITDAATARRPSCCTSDLAPTFDSVVYVNVLEHILDDAASSAPPTSCSCQAARWPSSCPPCPGSTAARLQVRAPPPLRPRRRCAATVDGGRVRAGRPAVPGRARRRPVLRDVPAARRQVAGPVSSAGYDRVIVPSAAPCSGSCPIRRSARTCSPSPASAERPRHRIKCRDRPDGRRRRPLGRSRTSYGSPSMRSASSCCWSSPTCWRSTTRYSIVDGSGSRYVVVVAPVRRHERVRPVVDLLAVGQVRQQPVRRRDRQRRRARCRRPPRATLGRGLFADPHRRSRCRSATATTPRW